jgi:putative FmdB family regulatory protein
MPLYEYSCRQCDHTFEALVFAGETVACPQCHAEQLERLFSVPAKPRSEGAALPLTCNSDLPPCGPSCPRF